VNFGILLAYHSALILNTNDSIFLINTNLIYVIDSGIENHSRASLTIDTDYHIRWKGFWAIASAKIYINIATIDLRVSYE
jgi:hypothetical protein